MVTSVLACEPFSKPKADRDGSRPQECRSRAALSIHPSICPCRLLSITVALLRSGQVVPALRKRCSCREQPARGPTAFPRVFSMSFLISCYRYWKSRQINLAKSSPYELILFSKKVVRGSVNDQIKLPTFKKKKSLTN